MKNVLITLAILIVVVLIFLASGAAANYVFGVTYCLYTSSGFFGAAMIALGAMASVIAAWMDFF
jgi:hypothetical protein